MFFKKRVDPARSFEKITLRQSGMRCTSEHEIISKDGAAEITEYVIKYSDGEEKRAAEKHAVRGTDEVLKLINDCGLLSWDGFHGKHPRGIKDGTMFSLDAVIDGRSIHADGSQNFPRNYRDFTDGLYRLLNEEKI